MKKGKKTRAPLLALIASYWLLGQACRGLNSHHTAEMRASHPCQIPWRGPAVDHFRASVVPLESACISNYLADCCGVTYEDPCLLVRQVNQFGKLNVARQFCFGRADPRCRTPLSSGGINRWLSELRESSRAITQAVASSPRSVTLRCSGSTARNGKTCSRASRQTANRHGPPLGGRRRGAPHTRRLRCMSRARHDCVRLIFRNSSRASRERTANKH